MEDIKTEIDNYEYKGYRNLKITVNDMPNELFRDIAEMCGIDAAVRLLENFSGVTIAVPVRGFEKIEKKIILREYTKDYSSITIKRLAGRLNMVEKNIRNVLQNYGFEPDVEGQIHLFDKRSFNGGNNGC